MDSPLVHQSWLELKPNEKLGGNSEYFDDYYLRIKNKGRYNHIPKSVFEQWIHPLHNNWETLCNYSWLNYLNTSFELVEWSFEALNKVNVINKFEKLCRLRAGYDDFDQFFCIEEDKIYWKNEGTWKTPPIVLDNDSINTKIPEWSELEGNHQLIEGHSRFGYLRSIKKISDLNKSQIAKRHKIWLMKVNTF